MFNTLGLLLVYLAYLAFSTKRSLTYLHIFQQEEYDNGRFMRWITTNMVIDRRLSIALFLCGFLWFLLPTILVFLIVFICFTVIAVIEPDPRIESKKKLAMTARAQRILFVTLCLMALTGLWWFILPLPWIWIVNVQLLPYLMMLATTLLQPYETKIQNRFWAEAHEKLKALNPTVIGITGSFGKTSVKHILGHILKSHGPTLMTPGSVNTPMGITRIVREQLEESHQYFIVEMGAYGPGSIERLCRLSPPDLGVITSIGYAHYERFKSLDTVAQTKFELADAVIQKDGKVIVHESCLHFPHAAEMQKQHASSFIVCGESGVHDLQIEQIMPLPDGVAVRIVWKGAALYLTLPLYGVQHGHNAALAFAAAVTLGLEPENVITALRSVPPIQHRLEVKKQGDGTILIDDAYNSNPNGFSAALDVLAAMEGRKILVTPGMVELGDAHDEEHEKIGRKAAELCDVAIAVVPERIPSFIKGFKETAPEKPLIEAASFREASAWLDKNTQSGDIILLENDLPDLYEKLPKI